MKKILYILTAVILFTSCRSIDKMVESGNYDQALRYGVDKLRGKENKKTKYVKGLEKAYHKLNARDFRDITRLESENTLASMQDIISIYNALISRQEYIAPLLPLYSKDGYYANIDMKNYSPKIKIQKEFIYKRKVQITESRYNDALRIVVTARNGDKYAARLAYKKLKRVEELLGKYKDTNSLKQEVTQLGITRILVEPYAAGSNIAFRHAVDIISLVNTGKLNSYWKKFYTNEDNVTIDFIATLEIEDIQPGREREIFNNFTETKEIKDGKIPKKSKHGKIARDTLGKIIYTDKYKVVTAHIQEIEREKTAQMAGKIIIIDATNNTHINTIPINVQNVFDAYSCKFKGDKRALTNPKRLRDYCEPFPTDYEMTTNLAHSYKQAAESILAKQRFI